MPELNGMELLHVAKKKWNTPVLLISGDLNQGEEHVASLCNADVLRKAINHDTLLSMVQRAIQRGCTTDR